MIYDLSFNICFIGTYSFTIFSISKFYVFYTVLILVLLELILLQNLYSYNTKSGNKVLILVLLELILLPYVRRMQGISKKTF